MAERDSEAKLLHDVELALIRMIAVKDTAALGKLYDRRGRVVYSLALSIVRSVDDAEEVTQDVFMRIWNSASEFDLSRGSPMAWITTIARRLAIDRTRSRAYRAESREGYLDQVGDGTPSVNESEGAVTLAVQAREVSSALNRLERPQREVIQLSYFEGLSHARIAARLSAPLGTVKTQMREAVRQLREILGVRPSS